MENDQNPTSDETIVAANARIPAEAPRASFECGEIATAFGGRVPAELEAIIEVTSPQEPEARIAESVTEVAQEPAHQSKPMALPSAEGNTARVPTAPEESV